MGTGDLSNAPTTHHHTHMFSVVPSKSLEAKTRENTSCYPTISEEKGYIQVYVCLSLKNGIQHPPPQFSVYLFIMN